VIADLFVLTYRFRTRFILCTASIASEVVSIAFLTFKRTTTGFSQSLSEYSTHKISMDRNGIPSIVSRICNLTDFVSFDSESCFSRIGCRPIFPSFLRIWKPLSTKSYWEMNGSTELPARRSDPLAKSCSVAHGCLVQSSCLVPSWVVCIITRNWCYFD